MTEALVEPVELSWSRSIVRGYRWHGDDNWIVLLHDVGADLDAWGDLPAALAASGYSVLAIDLPGHGLSDGDWESELGTALVDDLVRVVKPPAGRCFVIAAGLLSEPAVRSVHVDAVVALSPSPYCGEPPRRTPPTLVMVGGASAAAADAANRFFRATRGWTVVSSFGTEEHGTSLLRGPWAAHALEQVLIFLRDYRSYDLVAETSGVHGAGGSAKGRTSA